MAPGNQTPATRPVNLSSVEVRRKNVHDPELVINWDSYTAETRARAAALLTRLSPAAGAGTTKPDCLAISELTDGSGDLTAVPTVQKGSNTLDMRWSDRGRQARIDFAPYFMLRRFPIPKGTAAHIPVSIPDLSGADPVLKIHFSEARFEPIKEKKQSTT